ncbi:hypothetical protein [Aliikangiella sp. IMCC44359]|uniref:hypothetical protein n=1 Tax=Aliikangiella sp. IMCC44359 TaxID=3459125 RepID=UPI00403B11C8
MWAINNLNNNTSPLQNISFSDGQSIEAVRGPEGASFRLIVDGFGFLDFTDTGHQAGGPHYWQLIIGKNIYWYDGQGAIDLTINNDGSYQVAGDGNEFSGQLLALPEVSQADIDSFNWMMENKYIPYQNIPDEPGKTTEQIKQLGRQYFPYSQHSFQLAMSIYDWTTADFTRIDFMRLFTYTGLDNKPLDMNSIANGIWTANWPPYTPQDKDYMNSFMMVPANSLQEVQSQLDEKASSLYINNLSEINIITAALLSMPRTSCLAKPKLYSGQVAISNLGTEHFATYFLELPANSDPAQPPLQMPLTDAINSFLAVGNTVTLKSFMAFTDSFKDAQHYSNGIVLIVSPPNDAVTWDKCTYITPLSDGPEKTEYLFQVNTQFKVLDTKKVTVNSNELIEIYLQVVN